jgi:Trk K+ transport system NAD-binding subunit
VSTLRDCAETTVALDIREDGPLVGEFVGWLPGTVLAIERESTVDAMPDDRVTLRDGDRVFLVGRPDQLASVSERLAADRISVVGRCAGEQGLG